MKRTPALASVLAAACLAAGSAHAATASDTFVVTATVNAACQISASDLSFGNYDPLAGDGASTSSVTVTCSNGLPYQVTLDQGMNAAGGDCATPVRRMSDNQSNTIEYGLFTDAGYLTPWGCDITSDVDGTGSGAPQVLTVHGRLPAAQSMVAGTYTDSIVATINF